MQSQLMGGLCNNAVKTDLLGLKTHYPGKRKKSMSERPYSYLVNLCPSLHFAEEVAKLNQHILKHTHKSEK